MFEAVPGSVWFHFSSASAASASFSSNSSSIPSSSLSVSSSSVSSSSSSVSFSSVSSSSSSGFSSYPNIENFVSVVSQIEFVVFLDGPTQMCGRCTWLPSPSLSCSTTQRRILTNVRFAACCAHPKFGKNGIKGRRMYSLIYETTIRRIVA